MAIATSTTNELDNIKIDENNDEKNNNSNNCCINSSDTTSNIIISNINTKNTTKLIGNNSITSCISNNSNNNSSNNFGFSSNSSSSSVNCISNKNTIKHKTKSHETKSFVADRIQNWNRSIPEEGYITLGTIRYGVRLSTGSNPINFPTEKFSISTGSSTSSSTSCSRSLPPTPYLNKNHNIFKERRGSEKNQSNVLNQNYDSANSIHNNKSIKSKLNNNNKDNNSINKINSSNNNSNSINKENNSSDSKTSSIYRCESDRSTTSNNNYCTTSCCSCLNKTSIAIPCWNKNLCNRNNACCNSNCTKKKSNTKGSDISLDTLSSRTANYRLQTRTTTTTDTKTKLSTKKTQFPSTSSFSSSITQTDLSPSINIPFSRTATVMSAPKLNFLAPSNILLAPNSTITTTTTTTIAIATAEKIITTSAQIHNATTTSFNNNITKLEQIQNNNNNNNKDEDDIDNAPIPPIRTTSQNQYLKSYENNSNNNSNGSIYNNGNIHINSNNNSSNSSSSNNNTLTKISRLKYGGQKNNETNKNLTKIPTAIGNSHSDYNSINILSSLSSSVSSILPSTSISTSTQSLLSSSLPTTLSHSTGSVTTTRISTKISPITTSPTQLHHKLNASSQENYKNSIPNKNDNNILNQQQQQQQQEQQLIQKNSQNINGNSQCFYQENEIKMCQTPDCSCSNTKNSVFKNSNDHVYSHHEIKNTTDEQQQHYENEFGQNSRDNIENSSLSSVLAETRSHKFNKKFSSSSSQKPIREENRELNSYPLQNSKSLPIATSSLAKYQNQENYNYNKNYNGNTNINTNNNNNNNISKENNNINNFKNDILIQQKNEKYDNGIKETKCCHTNNNNINKNDNKTNINLKNKNEQNILLKNSDSNINCCSTINCSCSNNNNNNTNQIPHQNNQNQYIPQPHILYTGGSIPRAIIQQTLDTVVQRSLGIDRKNSESNGYDKINKITSTTTVESTNGSFNTLRQRRLSPPPPVPPKPNRHHQQVVRSKSVDSNVNNYQNTNFDTLIKDTQQKQQNNNQIICDSNFNNSDSTITTAYDPSKFRRKLLKFEQKNFIIKKSPSAGLDLLNCFTKSNTTDDLNINPKRNCESSNDLVNRNNYINTNNNKNLYQNDNNNHNKINKFNDFKNDINNDTSSSTSLSSSEIKLYSNTTPSLVIRKLTPKLTRKTINFGNSNNSNDLSNVNNYKNRSVSEDRLLDDNSSDNNDLNSYCDSLGSVNDPIIESPIQNINSNFLIYGEPIPIIPIQTKSITINKKCTIIKPQIKIKSSLIESQSFIDDIGFIDSSEKEDSDSFDIKNDNNNSKYITNIFDYPKSIKIYKNTHFKSEYDSNTKLLQINKENDKTEIINETNNNNTINNNNNNNSNENENNNKNNDITTTIINDRIIFKDLYDSLSDSLETSTISCLSETTTTTTATTNDLLTNINCGCRFQICNEINNSNDSNDSYHNNNNNNSNDNSNNNITSDIDLCLLNNINENGLKKSSDLCCCNERVKRFCKELKNQEFNHIKHNNNKNKSIDNSNNNNNNNNKQIKIFKSNSDNFIKNKEYINQFLVNHLNNNNNNSILLDDNNKNLNNIKNNLNDSTIITKTITNLTDNNNTPPITISPTNSFLIGLPPLPPPLPPLQFRNNTNSLNSNYSSCSSDSKIHRYDWNSELSDLNSISGNSNSSDSNSIHSNHSNTSSSNTNLSNISGIQTTTTTTANQLKNIQFKKIPSIESFNYVNSNIVNNNNFGKLRTNNSEDINNLTDKEQQQTTKIKNNMERRRNTLDRLQDQIRLNFGRRSSPSPTQQEKQRKSAEKSEKLRELTELLRGTNSSAASSTSSQSNRFSPTPPPIPPPRKPRHGSQQSSFDKSNEKLPPDPGPPPSPISPLRAADSEDILPMDQEVEEEPHRYSAPQLRSPSTAATTAITETTTIIESQSSPPLPPPPPPLPPQPLFLTQPCLKTKVKCKKSNKDANTSTHEQPEINKSTLMSTLRPNSSVSNLEAFIFGRGGRGKSKSPPPFVTLTKSISKDESTATDDDICTSLPKPESRTVIGSYTQKGIPYRSASFSQIDYSSGKYVKSAFNAFRERFRKIQDKNQADSVVEHSNLTLPRKKDDRDSSSEENKPKEPDFIYIPLKKSELNINLRYDDIEKPKTLEDRVNPPEIIMEEDSQMSELDSPMRTEPDYSPDMSETSDSIIVPTTILEDKSDENQNKIYPKSSPIEVSREGSIISDLVNSSEKDLLMESPPDNMKTSTACLIPIPVYESTESPMTGSRENVSNIDSRSVEAIPTVLNQEESIFVQEPLEAYDSTGSPDNLPRISVSQNTPQGSIDEGEETPSLTGEINPARLSVEQTFDDQPVLPLPVEEVLTRPIEFTEVKKRYSNDAIIGDRSHSADSILSRGGSSEEKRKRDKSKRRMGLYFQWPAVETTEVIVTDPDWTPSIETSSFEEKQNIPLDITKVDFSTLKSEDSQNENLSLFLNDAINHPDTISTTQTPESVGTYDTSTPESDSNSKPKMWSRFNRRTSLTCQSSEEKDDVPSPAPSSHRSNRNLLCFKNDSTSDNESDRTPPPSRDRTSPSPAPGDSDFKRYSKRPLRGPYGQMLEAEMKKPGKVHYDEIFEELKENDSLGKIQSNHTRSQSNRSFDETRTIPQHSNSMRVRKTANLPIPVHTRAASTPSQMESVAGSPSSGNNRINSKDTDNSKNKDTNHKKCSSSDIQRDRSPKRASSEAPDMKLLNHAKRSPSSSSDRHHFLNDKAPKRSFEEMRFSQTSRTNSERSTISESNKSVGGCGSGGGNVSSNVSSSSILVPSPELLAALLKGSSERQVSEQRQQTIVDTRNHIVEEIYRTEASYVDALTTIVTKYYNVLKTPEYAGLIDTKAVDEIFYMTNELLSIHKKFYNDLKLKSDPSLDPTLCCESFLETFSKTEVLETYTCFVNNRCRAHEAVKTAIQARPAFGKFLEATAREQKGKLSLDNLLIKPIQKFVNYEMLFTRLLKHTDSDIDQKPIQDVLKLVHDILLHLDCKKKEINENGQREDTLRQYETYIEGISDLVVPERQFLLYDLVQLPSNHTSNHMRGLFLFSDLLVITSIKRRSGAIKKQDFRSNTSTLDVNFASTLENIKYKFLRKFPLEYVEIVKNENARRIVKDYEQLIDDRSKIQQIDQIQTSIKFQSTLHQVLEQTVRNYLSEVESRLTECERQLNDGQLNSLKFMINIPGDSTQLTVLFGKAEKRAKCEEIFNDAKQKLAACLERHPTPEFLRSIALRKTRAGLQFTCAAPTLTDQKDVWVCNSDGYIGQVAVLSIQENPPTVSSCNGVCNARILCIASVPAYKETRKPQSRQSSTEEAPQSCRNSSSSDNSKKTSSSTTTTSATTTATVKDSVGGVSTGGDINEIQLDSNSSSDDSDPEQLGNTGTINESNNASGNGVGVGISIGIDTNNSSNLNQENRISSPIPKTVSSMSNLSTIHHQHQDSNSDDSECQQSTMWLGTEDGCIHVYNSTDNIRIKKNKIKIEHSSAVYSILYFDNKVFVSLANGDICVYLRDNVGWNTSHPLCISIGTVTSPVTKLLNVNGKLWCSIQGTIKVLDTKSLQVENTIQISTDSKPITNMAICNNCVWISIQNSAVIKCFHSTSHELIFEVNLAPSVNKMLSNCDDIIRQHKAACLRVTSLLACKDLIWIGTSAGVLLTIPAQCYIKGQINNTPIVTGIPHGHTGHVRFLTSVESNSISENGTNATTTTLLSSSSTLLSSTISDNHQQLDITNTQGSNNSYNINYNNNNNNNNNNNSISSSSSGNNSNNRSGSRTRSEIGSSNNLNSNSNINITTTSKYSSKSVDSSLDRKSKRNAMNHNKNKTKNDTGKILIISGGDGYENFGNTNANSPSEIAGREDSTNHLLLWQI